jgi:hypothetical protein
VQDWLFEADSIERLEQLLRTGANVLEPRYDNYAIFRYADMGYFELVRYILTILGTFC